MPKRLSVPYYPQNKLGFCLAACAQMVLAYGGSIYDQAELAENLGVQPYLGAPARNIHRLASRKHEVTVENGDLSKLQQWLAKETPVITFIRPVSYLIGEASSFNMPLLSSRLRMRRSGCLTRTQEMSRLLRGLMISYWRGVNLIIFMR